MPCLICGSPYSAIHANESCILDMCHHHAVDHYPGMMEIPLQGMECKKCQLVAKCCRTRVKKGVTDEEMAS